MRTFQKWCLALLVLGGAAFSIGAAVRPVSLRQLSDLQFRFDRGDLWRVVAYVCLPAATLGVPFPCAKVHDAAPGDPGWVWLPVGTNHILTVPTERMIGIESPAALEPSSATYWQAAWEARSLLESGIAGHPARTSIALAVNSAFRRTQDQLHIHTACVDAKVVAALTKDRNRITTYWSRMATPINGVYFIARRVEQADLSGLNIFALLPAASQPNPAVMARQTVAVIGAHFDTGDGFYLLNAQADQHVEGTGEALLEYSCRGLATL